MFAGKMKMGQRGRRGRVSLYFSTLRLRVEFLLKTDSGYPNLFIVLTLFILKAPNYVLAQTLTERVV